MWMITCRSPVTSRKHHSLTRVVPLRSRGREGSVAVRNDCSRDALRRSRVGCHDVAQVAVERICPDLTVRTRVYRTQLYVRPAALQSDTAFDHPSNAESSRDLR